MRARPRALRLAISRARSWRVFAARRSLVWALGGHAVFGLSGCEQILQPDVVVNLRAGHVPEAGPDNALPTFCQPDELHCEGVALQICRPDGSGFRTARICSTPQLCCDTPEQCAGTPGCQAPACAPGDFRCEGAALSICNEGQTGWTVIDTCASPTQCNARLGRCSDQPCSVAPAEYQCSGTDLQQCEAFGWRSIAPCDSRALCNSDPAVRACEPGRCLNVTANQIGPFQCENADLMRCNDAQTGFQFVETCVNAISCNGLIGVGDPYTPFVVATDLQQLGCQAPDCTPGRYECQGSRLLRCNINRTRYSILEADCGTPGQCNASAGRCDAEPCTPGAHQCSGKDYQICTPQQTWASESLCSSAAQCNPALGCEKALCDVAEYRCDSASLQRCNINGNGWVPVYTCETPELCNSAAKRCDTPVCAAGEQRCTREAKLEQCSPGHDAWLTVSDCAALATPPLTASSTGVSAVCDLTGSGQCLPQPMCEAGTRRCNGQFLERCEGNAWRPEARCATPGLCNPLGAGSCTPATCEPGGHRCVRSEADPVAAEPGASTGGLTLQACNATGSGFQTVANCADTFCDSARGQCDLCEPYQALCREGTLYRCSADGQETELEKACALGCVSAGASSDAGMAPAGRAACLEDLARDSMEDPN